MILNIFTYNNIYYCGDIKLTFYMIRVVGWVF